MQYEILIIYSINKTIHSLKFPKWVGKKRRWTQTHHKRECLPVSNVHLKNTLFFEARVIRNLSHIYMWPQSLLEDSHCWMWLYYELALQEIGTHHLEKNQTVSEILEIKNKKIKLKLIHFFKKKSIYNLFQNQFSGACIANLIFCSVLNY